MNAPSAVLLVDLDHCPSQAPALAEVSVDFCQVIVCHGTADPRLPLSLLPLLSKALQAGQVTLVPAPRRDRSSSSLGLAFFAGQLLAQTSAETSFVLLSEDPELETVVALLQQAGRSAKRLDSRTRAVQPPPAAVDVGAKTLNRTAIDHLVEEYREEKLHSGAPRPSSRGALRIGILDHFYNRGDIDPDKLIEQLEDDGFLRIREDGRVLYRDGDTTHITVSESGDDIPF